VLLPPQPTIPAAAADGVIAASSKAAEDKRGKIRPDVVSREIMLLRDISLAVRKEWGGR